MPNGGGYVVSRELMVGAGIVDLVVGTPKGTNLEKRLNHSPVADRKISGIEAVVLSYLHFHRPLKPRTIARRSGIRLDTVLELLQSLAEVGFCLQPSKETFVRAPKTDYFDLLIAIEGKLQRWQRALQQAYRNRLFSAYSYVVMDARRARPAIRAVDAFKVHGVGLAVAGSNSQIVEIIYQPSASKPISSIFSLIASEALASRVANRAVELSEGLQGVVFH